MSEKTTEVQAPPPRPSASVLPLFGQARGAPGPSGPSSDPSGLRSWPSGRSRSSNLASRLANAGACSAAVPGASSGAALGAMLQGRRASSAHCGLATPPGGTMPSATDILVRLGGRTLARLSLPEPRLGSWASSRSQAAFIGPEWPRSTSAESETGSSKLLLALLLGETAVLSSSMCWYKRCTSTRGSVSTLALRLGILRLLGSNRLAKRSFMVACISARSRSFSSLPKDCSISMATMLSDQKTNTCMKLRTMAPVVHSAQ
mmetsp:Transcript_60107/g.186061  ORF Transcript_60107/g.186061 Transcript_60107/m.186061 type:complete len:261 (-) Transcript_60107:365-1147(-)